MKHISLLLISVLFVHVIVAQDRLDILILSGKFSTPQDYESVYQEQAQEKSSFIALNLPIPVSKNTIIYNSLNYFYFNVTTEADIHDSLVNPIGLHGFILRTGLVQKFGNGQSIQLLLAPRIMTDMKGGGMDNFQFGGLAMYQKVYSSNLTLGFGAMYNQEFFGPYFVPVVNLKWQISERFSFSGLLPVYSKIKYKASDRLTLGISHFGLTLSFGLNDTEFEEDYMERQSIDLALFGHYNIYKNFFIEGRIGQSMSRSYAQYSSDQKVDFAIPLATFGDNREIKNVQFKDGIFFQLRLIYSIVIPEN